MNKHTKAINETAASLELARKFIEKYNVPECLTLMFGYEKPTFARGVYGDDGAVAACGEAFGTIGWIETLKHDGSADWALDIDGVKIILYSAKQRMPLEPRPVASKEFPLQIQEVAQ